MSMDEVGTALIAIAVVLSAVFIPTAFVSGITGQFYRQFAVTIATATLISAFVSLTLSPAMAAILFKAHHDDAHGHGLLHALGAPVRLGFKAFNSGFDLMAEGYGGLVRRLAGAAGLMLAGYARWSVSRSCWCSRRPPGSFRTWIAASSAFRCCCRPAPRWRGPTRCCSRPTRSCSARRASPTPMSMSAARMRLSPMPRTPAVSSWCSTVSTSATSRNCMLPAGRQHSQPSQP